MGLILCVKLENQKYYAFLHFALAQQQGLIQQF